MANLPPRTRKDGWTPERQADFLIALSRGVSVAGAAATVGMSRESAYRLRRRPHAAGFTAVWDSFRGPITTEMVDALQLGIYEDAARRFEQFARMPALSRDLDRWLMRRLSSKRFKKHASVHRDL